MTTRPLVTFFDPHSWSRDFSYEVEREALAARGVDLRVPNDVTERDELIERADVVISCGTTLVTAADIDRMANCIGIQCYSVGMDKVDHDRAAERRIAITNVNASTADVADHTLALVLAMQR